MATPSMTLFHSPASPFVRKVLVLLHETGQRERVQLEEVQLTPVSPSATLNAHNPAGKIPALRLADGNVLFDSRVILEYLDQQHVGEPLIPPCGAARWRRLTLAALADAILDAAVGMRYESFLRPEDKRWPQWLAAQGEKIERSLRQFEEQAIAELSSRFDIAAIGLACALGYLDFRQPELHWRQRFPQLAVWFAEVSQRPSMQASEPPAQ
jgi:glutathione S-transferase